ncbi:MAG: hypothetical protein LCH37_12945 [Bacteroidetes bacterium]|nr:hypothetical protein [Bacteroidota bacterium]
MREQELIDRWAALLKSAKTFQIAKVKEVSGVSCTVEPINGDVEISGVKLSFEDNPDTLIIPAVNSLVVVGSSRINKTDKRYFIVQVAKAQSIKLKGNQFSLTKTELLVEELNKTNAVVNAIKDSLLNWTVLPGDGGGALKTLFASSITGKQTGDFSDIKNDEVKHG